MIVSPMQKPGNPTSHREVNISKDKMTRRYQNGSEATNTSSIKGDLNLPYPGPPGTNNP